MSGMRQGRRCAKDRRIREATKGGHEDRLGRYGRKDKLTQWTRRGLVARARSKLIAIALKRLVAINAGVKRKRKCTTSWARWRGQKWCHHRVIPPLSDVVEDRCGDRHRHRGDRAVVVVVTGVDARGRQRRHKEKKKTYNFKLGTLV